MILNHFDWVNLLCNWLYDYQIYDITLIFKNNNFIINNIFYTLSDV